MLECFTLISGWVFGYQYLTKGSDICSFKQLVPKKIKRFVIPSILFSIIYILAFNTSLISPPLPNFFITQFRAMVYHTEFFKYVPNIMIPWLALVITLALSYVLTIIVRSNRLGRLII